MNGMVGIGIHLRKLGTPIMGEIVMAMVGCADLSRICLGFVWDLSSPEMRNFKIWQGATHVSIWRHGSLRLPCLPVCNRLSDVGPHAQHMAAPDLAVLDLFRICLGFVWDLSTGASRKTCKSSP